MTFRDLKFVYRSSDDRTIRTALADLNNGYLFNVYLFLPSSLTKGSAGWNVRITNAKEQESIHKHSQSIEQINELLSKYSKL